MNIEYRLDLGIIFFYVDDTSFQIAYGNVVISVKAASQSQKRQWINQIQHCSAVRTTMQ